MLIGREMYRPLVLQVIDRNDDGRPQLLRIVYTEAEISVEDGQWFIMSFLNAMELSEECLR